MILMKLKKQEKESKGCSGGKKEKELLKTLKWEL